MQRDKDQFEQGPVVEVMKTHMGDDFDFDKVVRVFNVHRKTRVEKFVEFLIRSVVFVTIYALIWVLVELLGIQEHWLILVLAVFVTNFVFDIFYD